MSPVDFYKLMNKATRREVFKGEKLLKEGEFNSQIHIILSGHVSKIKSNHHTYLIFRLADSKLRSHYFFFFQGYCRKGK